jgi:aminobenzoyl-glutamate utilization protein B
MMLAAKTLAMSMIDAFSNPLIIENAWKEFKTRTGENFTYETLIGNRAPALNYRD